MLHARSSPWIILLLPRSVSRDIHAIHGDGIPVGLPGSGYFLTIGIGINSVGVGDLINLAVFGDQHDLVAFSYASGNTGGVNPHRLAACRALLIDDVAGQGTGGWRSGCALRTAPAPARTWR